MDQRRQQQQRRRPVNVAEIMAQIRRRIEQKKRDLKIGTEFDDLAAMKLKPLPDPQQVKSLKTPDLYGEPGGPRTGSFSMKNPEPRVQLVDPFTRPLLEFEKPNVSVEALFYSSRGGAGRFLMIIRKFTRPLLKLFLNLDAYVYEQAHVNQVLRNQTITVYERLHQQILDLRDRDDQMLRRIDYQSEWIEWMQTLRDQTAHYVKLLHGIQTNLVAELTTLAIENQNLRSRLAEMTDQLDLHGKREAIMEEQVQRIEETRTPLAQADETAALAGNDIPDAHPDRS